eukprot:m51a1_g9585 hypothetical protein (120) ;mRNA; r:1004336-1005079
MPRSCCSWASSYLVLKWGGVVIHSSPTNTTPGSVYRIPTEALSHEASAFSLQLRELLGIACAQDGDCKFVGDVYIEHMRHEHRAADWEADAAAKHPTTSAYIASTLRELFMRSDKAKVE